MIKAWTFGSARIRWPAGTRMVAEATSIGRCTPGDDHLARVGSGWHEDSGHLDDAAPRHQVDNRGVATDRPPGKGLSPILVIKYAGPGLVFFTAATVYSGYATVRGFDSHNSVLELLAPVGAAGGLYMVVAMVRGIVRKIASCASRLAAGRRTWGRCLRTATLGRQPLRTATG